jgi:DNA-binding MarR family transcriptional regulator
LDTAAVTTDFIGFRLHRLVNLMNRPFFAVAPSDLGLSTYAWRAMVVIAVHPGASAGQVGQETGLLPMSVSRALALLRDKGCVRDEQDRNDLRVSRYWLTKQGRAIYEQFGPFARQKMEEFFQVLSDEQMKSLEELLHVLTQQAETLTREMRVNRAVPLTGFNE